jgi:hypothetical protein
MIDPLRKISLRRRVSLTVFAVNAILCVVLVAFMLR